MKSLSSASAKIVRAACGACALLAASALLIAAPSSADGMARDADGSRMQARVQALRTTQQDSLQPPIDRVDWRTFKLANDAAVSVIVRSSPAQIPVQVQLTDGRGNVLVSGGKAGGDTLRRQLSAGLYYVSVSASARVDYSITIE
jgi:hypothetical protein